MSYNGVTRVCVGRIINENLNKMKRPKRENYPNGIYGDISYNDRLERYTSYLENRLKERDQALRIHDVVGRSEQLVCDCPDEKLWDIKGKIVCECGKYHERKAN
jgi:hypothetical protein